MLDVRVGSVELNGSTRAIDRDSRVPLVLPTGPSYNISTRGRF